MDEKKQGVLLSLVSRDDGKGSDALRFDVSKIPLLLLTLQGSCRYAVDPDCVYSIAESMPDKKGRTKRTSLSTSDGPMEVGESFEKVLEEYMRAFLAKKSFEEGDASEEETEEESEAVSIGEDKAKGRDEGVGKASSESPASPEVAQKAYTTVEAKPKAKTNGEAASKMLLQSSPEQTPVMKGDEPCSRPKTESPSP